MIYRYFIFTILAIIFATINSFGQSEVTGRTGEKAIIAFDIPYNNANGTNFSCKLNISNYRVFLVESAETANAGSNSELQIEKIDFNNYLISGLAVGYPDKITLRIKGEILAAADTLCDITIKDVNVAGTSFGEQYTTLRVIPDSPGEVYYKPCYFYKSSPDPATAGNEIKFTYYVDCIANVKIRISDPSGKTTAKMEYQNVSRGMNEAKFNIPINFSAGAYYVELFTDCGFGVGRFTVVK